MVRSEMAFDVAEYRSRLDRVRASMAQKGLDAILVTSPENICYVAGYRTVGYYYIQALLVTMDADPVLVTRLFEQRNIDAFSWLNREECVAYRDIEDPIETIANLIRSRAGGALRLGIEKTYLTFLPLSAYDRLKVLLPEAELLDSSGIIETHRRIKSPKEIEYIRTSCRISEAGLDAARDHCGAGITENELSAHIHKAMIERGCEFPGLPPFIGSGYRTHIPHVQWTAKVIESGDNVPVELTGVTQRYAGPLFRTFYVGKAPEKMKRDFHVVKDQLEAAIEAIKPGVTSHDVDLAAKNAAARHDKLSSFTKRTGYSIGLNYAPDWGEGHFLDLKEQDQTVLEAGMTFHIPMSLRADGELAVAVSESVLVTPTGCEVLTNYPRELIEV